MHESEQSTTLNNAVRESNVSDRNPKEHVRPSSCSPVHAFKNNELVITSIRATDVALGLGRIPAGFYTVVQHSGLEWRSENKCLPVNDNIIDWDGPISIPVHLSATVCLQIYASFEFQPMSDNGELLRQLTTTVEQLLDRSTKDFPFTFFPKDGDVVSPCSSLLVTVKRWKCESSDPSTSKSLAPHCSTTECRSQLKNATDDIHRALSHGDKRDLERSIERFERALNICPLDHPCRAAVRSNLALAKVILYKVNKTCVSLGVLLILYYRALSARPVGHSDRPSMLVHLAILHLARFEKGQGEGDAAQAEALLRQAMELSFADSHEQWAASSMLQLYAGRKMAPIQGTTESAMQQDSRSGITNGDPWTSSVRLLERYQRFGNLGDLQQAITHLETLVRSTSLSHPKYPRMLQNYGAALLDRFGRLGGLGDLEQAISRQADAVQMTPDSLHDKPAWLNNLGTSFITRFKRLGELGDLDQAISSQADAVQLTPDGHPNKPGLLNNLGTSFITRFERLGELGDLERAISRLADAVQLTPDGHPNKPGRLNNLGTSFRIRFQRLGELGDLEQAISRLADAVQSTPDSHPNKSGLLNNLGTSFRTRFERLGELGDLEQAISRQADAVQLTPDGHPDKPGQLNNLGISFRTRFQRLGELEDLKRAISSLANAVQLTPDGYSDKPGLLNNLGTSFITRFERLGELGDLERAISRLADAVQLTPDGHPNKPGWLNNLGNSFITRFERLGDFGDLEQATSRQADAVQLTPDGHPDKPTLLNNLGNSFRTRFQRLGNLGDLERAISRQADAVQLTPDGHPDKPTLLNNLGTSFITRFEHLGDLGDLERAISLYSHSASHSTGSPIYRFHASLQWIASARASGHHSLLHAYSVAVSLLPQLAWIGLSVSHRYRELIRGVGIVREAAATALESGYPEIAVEWLEQGRSIVWGELLQLRSSYDELSAVHPDQACRLRDLSTALEQANLTREQSFSITQDVQHHATASADEVANRHRAVAIERDNLLREIRTLPDFERFLLHKEFSQLRALAHSGPVVILNAAESHCDALIVLANVENVIHVPLPNFTLEICETLQTSTKSLVRDAHAITPGERVGHRIPPELDSRWESILSRLWKCVVKPVMDALGFSTIQDLERIFWCPTGPFTFLPIHAAGFYDSQYSQSVHKIFDFVVSSYVPTLSILAPSPEPRAVSSNNLRFLAVRQPPSDGLSHLPGVAAELRHIREIITNFPSQVTLFESSVGTVEEVLDLMRDADWVHFACHGIQDAANPAESGLCLANDRRLQLSNIIELRRPRGGLAFLSACQTATGDKTLSDEAIHIAAGMLFAGYGGVVGTMWSISDRLAPEVARDVYRQLFSNGTRPDYREAARALQDAIRRLRDGVASFSDWIPFIHVGL